MSGKALCGIVILCLFVPLAVNSQEPRTAAPPKNLERLQLRDGVESFSRYILTKDNSKISGKYIETVMLGRIAGDDNVEIGCIFSFQDSSDFSKCGTGQVKITATIANKRVLSGKDKFDLNFCDRFASVWAYVDLSSFDAQDELKCSFSVKDKVKLAIGGVNGIGGGKVDISALARKSESFPDR